jgi:hypothetical protein
VTDTAVHEELREALQLLELEVRLSAPLTEQAGLGSRAVARWTGEGVLRISAFDVGGVWARDDVALTRRGDDGGVSELVVATCTGLSIDLGHAGEAAAVLGSFVDYGHFQPLLDPDRTSGLAVEVEERWSRRHHGLVLLDRVELAPAWRGMGGVGRLVVARLLGWLAADARLAALQPFPTQFSGAGDVPGFAEAHAKVQQVWGSIGFTPWRDDIWCLDPASADLRRALTRLEDRLGVAED